MKKETQEIQAQAEVMAQAMVRGGREYQLGERIEMQWKEADDLLYRGKVEIDQELLDAAVAARSGLEK